MGTAREKIKAVMGRKDNSENVEKGSYYEGKWERKSTKKEIILQNRPVTGEEEWTFSSRMG